MVNGRGSLPNPGPPYKEIPGTVLDPSPRMTFTGKDLSTVDAPTVVIQGAEFDTVPGPGPEFPAAHETNTPFATAPKEAIAMGSWK